MNLIVALVLVAGRRLVKFTHDIVGCAGVRVRICVDAIGSSRIGALLLIVVVVIAVPTIFGIVT